MAHIPREFQENLTDLICTSLYQYNHIKSGGEAMSFDELEKKAFDEYLGKYNFDKPEMVYPHLNKFTNSLVGMIISEIDKLPVTQK